MATTIAMTDLGNSLQFELANGHKFVLYKLGLQIKQDETYVYLTNANGFVDSAENKTIRLRFNQVSDTIGGAALYTDNDELMTAITTAVESVSLGSSGGGGYDEGIDAQKVFVLNPDYEHYTESEHLVDFAAVGAATSRYVIPMEGYRFASIHAKLTAGAGDTNTMTVWASNNPDADDSADTDWVDISTDVIGAASLAAANSTEEAIYFIDISTIPMKLMIKIVTTGSANAADVYVKKSS